MNLNLIKIILTFYFPYYKIFSCKCNNIVYNAYLRKNIYKNLISNGSIKKNIDNINNFLENKSSDTNNIEQSIFDSKIYNLNLSFKIDDNEKNKQFSIKKNHEKAITINILQYKEIIEKENLKLNLNFKTYITKINNIPCLYFKNLNNQDKKVLIFYHGNSEDIINIIYYEKISTIFNVFAGLENGYDVIVPEFPGYSIYKSDDVNEEKMQKDTEEIYNKIKDKYNKITVLGFSLGCSLAIDFASCENSSKINMLILTHPFANIKSAAKHICCCSGICLKKRFKNDEKIKNIKCKTAILSAIKDNIVSPKDALNLYNILKETNPNVNLYKYTSIHGLPDIVRIRKIINEDKI